MKDKVQAQVYISTTSLKNHWENIRREVACQASLSFLNHTFFFQHMPYLMQKLRAA